MPPKTRGKTTSAKEPPKRATTRKQTPEKQATLVKNEYLGQEFEQAYNRCAVFVEKLIERLTYYGEDDKTLNDAFTNNKDLPPPNLKKAAATGSPPENVDKSSSLTKEIEELQRKLTKREEEMEGLGIRNKELDKQVKTYKHDLEKQKNSANRSSSRPGSAKHVPQVVSENDIDTLKRNLQAHKDELKKLRVDKEKEITELKEKNTSLESKFEMQRETLNLLQQENVNLKADIARKIKDAEKLQGGNSDLKQNRGRKMEAEQMQRGKSDLTKENEKLTETFNSLQQKNAELTADIEKKTKDVDKLQREISSLTRDGEKKRKEIEQLQKDQSDPIKDSQEKKKGGGKGDKTSSAEVISKLQDEVDGLRNRLSKMAGAQLTDNNPAIADLSDPNRPLSLGEKFSELYDNEWTDAMEEMVETMPDETKVIKLLLKIVCDAYQFCLDKSEQFMHKINNTLSGFSEDFSSSESMPKEIAKTNKDYRKSLAVYVVSFLQQEFAKETKTKPNTKVGTKTEAYMKRCVFVCWFMTVQDPKVCITVKKPEKFDEDLYKPYTKKGKRLDYLVWPVLHLHEGGPLIGKGVAQGKP